MSKLNTLIYLLRDQENLPNDYKDHALKGIWIGSREAHIGPDWLLIYRWKGEVLELVRTGTHSDLFS